MKLLSCPRVALRLGMASAALLAVAAAAPRAGAEEVVKSFSVTGRANVRVETNDASVRVTTSNTKQVEFRVEYQNLELNKNFRIDSRQDGDSRLNFASNTRTWN